MRPANSYSASRDDHAGSGMSAKSSTAPVPNSRSSTCREIVECGPLGLSSTLGILEDSPISKISHAPRSANKRLVAGDVRIVRSPLPERAVAREPCHPFATAASYTNHPAGQELRRDTHSIAQAARKGHGVACPDLMQNLALVRPPQRSPRRRIAPIRRHRPSRHTQLRRAARDFVIEDPDFTRYASELERFHSCGGRSHAGALKSLLHSTSKIRTSCGSAGDRPRTNLGCDVGFREPGFNPRRTSRHQIFVSSINSVADCHGGYFNVHRVRPQYPSQSLMMSSFPFKFSLSHAGLQ